MVFLKTPYGFSGRIGDVAISLHRIELRVGIEAGNRGPGHCRRQPVCVRKRTGRHAGAGTLRLRVRLHGGRPARGSPPGITPSRDMKIPWRWSERPSKISSPPASAPASGSPGSCAISPGTTPRASWWKRTSGTFSAAASKRSAIYSPLSAA